MRAFVTGGSGFIGSAVVRRLLTAGHQVRVLIQPGANTRQIDGLPIERLPGDIRERKSLRDGMTGCDWAFHIAALYSYWGHHRNDFYEINVEGTRRVLETASKIGIKRIVYTSSIATLGAASDGVPVTEDSLGTLADRIGPYQRSKFLAEEIAREFARRGSPLVIVNPSTPFGAGDHRPTPTGQIVVDFLNGRTFGYVDTGLNIVDVEDVAAGHLLAAERGKIGERYILGGENLTLKQILDLLAEISGRPPVRFRIPHWLALGWSYVDVTISRVNPQRIPTATPDTVRLSRRYEFFDPSRAVRELGLPQTPARTALRKAVEWYIANGYTPDGRHK